MKVCNTCKITQDLSCFNIDKSASDGHQYKCRKCAEVYRQQNKEKLKEYYQNHYENNKEQKTEYQKEYYKNNKNKLKDYQQAYNLENRDKIKHRQTKYREQNQNKINYYFKKRKKDDIQFRIASNLRARISKALTNNIKRGSVIKDLGCSVCELKQYLESKFQPGMCWENYGLYGWHIDHIIPLSSFDLTDQEQFLKACHYSNLQPLWAEENLKKSNKMESL